MCNPLGGQACLLPFPSSLYLAEDATTATGLKVAIPQEGMPANLDGIRVPAALYDGQDGFSPNAVIVAAFEGGVDGASLPGPQDGAASIEDGAPIVLLDMAAGTRIPYFAEVDQNVEHEDERALLIRPITRLAPGTRYAVAIRRSVKAPGGGELTRAPAFDALLAGTTFDHPNFAAVEARWPAIRDALVADGVPADDLALAWDFTTGSDAALMRDLTAMRDQALAAIDDGTVTQTYEAEVVPGIGDPLKTLRFVHGEFDAPGFLTGAREAPTSVITRDADGVPSLVGTTRFKFAAIVPHCVEAVGPRPLLVFGHGLFGGAEETLRNSLLLDVAEDQCVVIVSTDWIGLAEDDVTNAILAVSELSAFRGLVEKLPQGVVNTMALMRIARDVFADDPLFQDSKGEPAIDPSSVRYFGASLGGIMGNVFMAYEPEIARGALAVPGGNWTMLLERSYAWPALKATLQASYDAPHAYPLLVALIGTYWDRFDPITTAAGLTTAPRTGVPAKQILIYAALSDSLVNNVTTDMVARVMQLPVLTPSVRTPWGVPTTDVGVPSGVVWFDEHPTPVPPLENLAPSEDNGTHAGVNERAAVLRLVKRFLDDGVVESPCTAPGGAWVACDCATGACD